MVYLEEISMLLSAADRDWLRLFQIYAQITGDGLIIAKNADPTAQVQVENYLRGYTIQAGNVSSISTGRSVDSTELKEIFDLITIPRSTRQNRRLFELYNQHTGRKWKPCWCSSKIDTIMKYFREYLMQNGFVQL